MAEPLAPALPPADAAARLGAARSAFAALRPRVESGEPWPLAAAFGTEPEASWGPREVLAHTAEMLPYWLGELERVLEGARAGADVTPFGRIASDVVRIGILERDRSLPLRELFDRIDAGIARWERRLAELAPRQGAARGVHSTLGEMTADQLRDRFVVTHLDEHARQLLAILGEPSG